MGSLESDDQITIVNRSMEYKISKKLIRKIPYFDKMLSHGLLESKSAKIHLDFDEKALESVLKCVEFGLNSIDVENAINACNLIDYSGIDNFLNDCRSYLNANFSIELLPIIIHQATQTSKWINSSALNAFICRHFSKLINTTAWLCYPFETIEYICSLDLMIYSEMQVYNAIKSWVHIKFNSRKWYIKRLLQLVRWGHLKDEELSKIKKDVFFTDLGPIFCLDNKEDCDHIYNRTKQDYFIMIEELKGTDLRINILDDNFLPLISQVIKLDKSISADFFQDEHVTDIFFDSGRKRIRIDWCQSRYCFLHSLHNKTYYDKIYKYFITKYVASEMAACSCDFSLGISGSAFLEADDKLILIRTDFPKSHQWSVSRMALLNSMFYDMIAQDVQFHVHSTHIDKIDHFMNNDHSFHATVLNNNIYMLTNDLEFICCNIFSEDNNTIRRDIKLNYENLLLTSKQSNDDRVILIDKSTKDGFCYNVNTTDWSSINLMTNQSSTGDQKESNKLLTLTSAFISINTIRKHMNCKLN